MKRLASRIWRLSLAFVSLIVFAGCGGYVPHLLVMRANYNVSRGQYQNAVVDYLRASENTDYNHWISYNLGNVYHALGENTGAVEMWERALESDTAELMFGASFNRGVFLYERGRYREALEQFKVALQVAPTSRAAKKNFELTLEKIQAEEEIGRSNDSTAPVKAVADQSSSRILDYVGRKEEQRWRANAEQAVDPSVQDW